MTILIRLSIYGKIFRELESLKAQRAEMMSLSSVKTVEETLKWLDEIWQSGEIKETMTEEEYQEFRKSIENAEE